MCRTVTVVGFQPWLGPLNVKSDDSDSSLPGLCPLLPSTPPPLSSAEEDKCGIELGAAVLTSSWNGHSWDSENLFCDPHFTPRKMPIWGHLVGFS